jgi:hypothetical protein
MVLLVYLHVVFNQKPVTCLSHLHDNWPRHGVLRVELFFEPPPKGYNLQQSYEKEFQNNYLSNERNQSLTKQNQSEVNTSLVIESSPSNENQTIKTAEIIDENYFQDDDDALFDIIYDYFFNFDWIKQFLIEEQHILEYSLEYGFLRLSPETRERLNIEVLLVTLDMSNNTCFGGGLTRFMLDQFLGYQEILMSSIKQLAEKETDKGKEIFRKFLK